MVQNVGKFEIATHTLKYLHSLFYHQFEWFGGEGQLESRVPTEKHEASPEPGLPLQNFKLSPIL